MSKYICFTVFCLSLLASPSFAGPLEEGWTEAKKGDGIVVYTRPVKGSDMSEFMGVADINAPMEVVEQVFLDFPSYTQWYAFCKEFRKLQDLPGEYHYKIYYVNDSPFPVKDRDMILEIRTDRSPKENVIHMKALTDNTVPPSSKYVRMTKLVGKTTMTKVNDKLTHVVYMVNSDPAGSVPIKLANMVAKDQPFKTLKNLKEMVKKDVYYQKAGLKK